MSEREWIAALEKAIRDADSWLRAGEGVPLTYYHSACYSEDDSVAVITRVLNHESPLTAKDQQ